MMGYRGAVGALVSRTGAMDFEAVMEGAVSGGNLERAKARPERWPELLACLWHIQDLRSWPLVNGGAIAYLRSRGEMSEMGPADDYAEYAAALQRLSEVTGGDMEIVWVGHTSTQVLQAMHR